MLTVDTTTLNLVETWLDSDAEQARVRVNFPLNRTAGTEGGAVVYFELEPGRGVGRHTDSLRRSSTSWPARPRPRSATSAAL